MRYPKKDIEIESGDKKVNGFLLTSFIYKYSITI